MTNSFKINIYIYIFNYIILFYSISYLLHNKNINIIILRIYYTVSRVTRIFYIRIIYIQK